MSELVFHKCMVCGDIFYSCGKTTYCARCIPKFKGSTSNKVRAKAYFETLKDSEIIEAKRARDRLRWHKRMANPVFREHERIRSLARYKAEKKYATREAQDEA